MQAKRATKLKPNFSLATITILFILSFVQAHECFANSKFVCQPILKNEIAENHYEQANVNRLVAHLLRDIDELHVQFAGRMQSNIQREVFQFRIRGIENETEDLLKQLGIHWIPFMVPFSENLRLSHLAANIDLGLRRQFFLKDDSANPFLKKLFRGIYWRAKNWNIKIVIDPLLDDHHLVGFYDTDKNAIFLSLRSLIGSLESHLARFIRHEFHHAQSAIHADRPGSLIRKTYTHQSHESLPIGYEESFNLDEIEGHLRDLRILNSLLNKYARIRDARQNQSHLKNQIQDLKTDFEIEYETICQFMQLTIGRKGMFAKIESQNLVWTWTTVSELGLILDQVQAELDQEGSQLRMWLLLDSSLTKQERIQQELQLTKRRIDRVYSEVLRIGKQYELKCEI